MTAPLYEPRDAPPRQVAQWGALLALTLALLAGSIWLMGDFTRPPATTLTPQSAREPPAPRLQASPAADAAAYHAAMDAKLRGYGWIDRGRGVARIPIETAMDILAARGWPSPAGGAP